MTFPRRRVVFGITTRATIAGFGYHTGQEWSAPFPPGAGHASEAGSGRAGSLNFASRELVVVNRLFVAKNVNRSTHLLDMLDGGCLPLVIVIWGQFVIVA